jgi:hypothetical protein
MTQDQDQLRLLSIFHYVVGGLAGLFALFPMFHLVIGLLFILAPEKLAENGDPPPAFLGWIFVVFAAVFITIGWIFAAFVMTAGRFLAKRKHYTFCLVMAGIECMFMPFGTVLGIFTILVLMRDPVKQLFQDNQVSR